MTPELKYKVKRRFRVLRTRNADTMAISMIGLIIWELNDSCGLPAKRGHHYTFYFGKYGLDLQFYKEYTL